MLFDSSWTARYKLITDWVFVKIYTSDDECNWNPPSYRRSSCHPLFPDHSDQPRAFVQCVLSPSHLCLHLTWWAPMNSIRKCFTSVLPLSGYRPITPITILQLTCSHHYFHQKSKCVRPISDETHQTWINCFPASFLSANGGCGGHDLQLFKYHNHLMQ